MDKYRGSDTGEVGAALVVVGLSAPDPLLDLGGGLADSVYDKISWLIEAMRPLERPSAKLTRAWQTTRARRRTFCVEWEEDSWRAARSVFGSDSPVEPIA